MRNGSLYLKEYLNGLRLRWFSRTHRLMIISFRLLNVQRSKEFLEAEVEKQLHSVLDYLDADKMVTTVEKRDMYDIIHDRMSGRPVWLNIHVKQVISRDDLIALRLYMDDHLKLTII